MKVISVQTLTVLALQVAIVPVSVKSFCIPSSSLVCHGYGKVNYQNNNVYVLNAIDRNNTYKNKKKRTVGTKIDDSNSGGGGGGGGAERSTTNVESKLSSSSSSSSWIDIYKQKPGTLIVAPFVLLFFLDIIANILVLTKRTVEYALTGQYTVWHF